MKNPIWIGDRRTFLRAGAAAVAATALAPTALARAPRVGKQAEPGFYRFKLGTIEITVVSDGTLAFPAETLWGDRAEDARGLLTSTFHTPRPVGLQINTVSSRHRRQAGVDRRRLRRR